MPKQWRTKVELSFNLEGTETPPTSFELRRTERHEQNTRNDGSGNWLEDSSQTKRETIADGITRRQLVRLIEDAADWLAYIGD